MYLKVTMVEFEVGGGSSRYIFIHYSYSCLSSHLMSHSFSLFSSFLLPGLYSGVVDPILRATTVALENILLLPFSKLFCRSSGLSVRG